MILLALDPGPTSCGYARVSLAGARATYITGGLVASQLETLEALLGDVDALALEVVRQSYSPKFTGPIIATARVVGAIAWMAQARRLRCIEFTAAEIRKLLCGKANANDHAVADVVARNVADFPARSNVHQRDAAALAVVAAWKLSGSLGERAS